MVFADDVFFCVCSHACGTERVDWQGPRPGKAVCLRAALSAPPDSSHEHITEEDARAVRRLLYTPQLSAALSGF